LQLLGHRLKQLTYCDEILTIVVPKGRDRDVVIETDNRMPKLEIRNLKLDNAFDLVFFQFPISPVKAGYLTNPSTKIPNQESVNNFLA